MRTVGIIFVLAAAVAIQLPWLSCHGDCQHSVLAVVGLDIHHASEEADHAHEHLAHGCSAHGCSGHGCPQSAASEGEVGNEHDHDHDHDHGPGDHELLFKQSRRPASTGTLISDLRPLPGAIVSSDLLDRLTPSVERDQRIELFDAGPLPRLATVRLQL